MPAMLVEAPGIFPREYKHDESTCSVIGLLNFFKHLQHFQQYRILCCNDCFSILDHPSTTFQLKTENNVFIFNGENLH